MNGKMIKLTEKQLLEIVNNWALTELTMNDIYLRFADLSDTAADTTQIGGDHYKGYKIQPVEFIHANEIPFLEANVIKYVMRHKDKNGLEDLQKAKHYIDLLIQLQYD